jgi:acid stress-induced BolA-like protein IbaG/YrbA
MNIESIEDELRSAFPNSDVVVFSKGNLLELNIKAEQFKDISKVRRQQMIYAVINHRIKTGEVHAVRINATSSDEREK